MTLLFSRGLAVLLLVLVLPLGVRAEDRAQALMRFEGIAARYQAAYGPGAFARQLQGSAALDGRVSDAVAFKALDVAASPSFQVANSVAAIGKSIAAVAPGAAVDEEVRSAVTRFVQLRDAFAAQDDSARAAATAQKLAQPVDSARVELLQRMAIAGLREVDFSNQLLLTAVLRNLVRDGPGQLGGMSDPALDQGVETLWARGVTSGRARNLLIVAKELDLQAMRAVLADLPDADVAALLAWRSDPQSTAESDALLTAYRDEVKAGGARTIRTLVRRWPR